MRFTDSTTGNSVAASVDSTKRLRPAAIFTFSPSIVTVTVAFSGSALRDLQQLAPRHRDLAGLRRRSTSPDATSSTSRSVPVTDRRLPFAASSTLASTGIVCLRSTTPMTACSGPSDLFRESR